MTNSLSKASTEMPYGLEAIVKSVVYFKMDLEPVSDMSPSHAYPLIFINLFLLQAPLRLSITCYHYDCCKVLQFCSVKEMGISLKHPALTVDTVELSPHFFPWLCSEGTSISLTCTSRDGAFYILLSKDTPDNCSTSLAPSLHTPRSSSCLLGGTPARWSHPSIHPCYSSQSKTCHPVQKPSYFAWISGQGNLQCLGVTKASYWFSRRFKSKSHWVRKVHSFYRTPAFSNVDTNLSIPLGMRVRSQSSIFYWAAPPFRSTQPDQVLRLLSTDDFLEKLKDWWVRWNCYIVEPNFVLTLISKYCQDFLTVIVLWIKRWNVHTCTKLCC